MISFYPFFFFDFPTQFWSQSTLDPVLLIFTISVNVVQIGIDQDQNNDLRCNEIFKH